MKSITAIRVFIVAMSIASFIPGEPPSRAFAEGSTPAEGGEALFQAKCSPCHSIGGGRLVGPDLKGVTSLRDHEWLGKFISSPDRVLAGGDPVATRLLKEYGGVAMPNLGLSESQVDKLLAFLEESAPKEAASPPAMTKVVTGAPQRGAALFTGVIRFQQGGAPCFACHTVSGTAPLGGGSFGPDLTGIHGRLGATGLSLVLASLPFPTMRPIYQSRPLTSSEQEDLSALFQAAAGRQPVDAASRITILAVAGFLLLLLLAGVAWRKRLKSVRRALVEEMTVMRGDRS